MNTCMFFFFLLLSMWLYIYIYISIYTYIYIYIHVPVMRYNATIQFLQIIVAICVATLNTCIYPFSATCSYKQG